MISVGPTQKAVRNQVEYFVKRRDFYNAREAAKGITDEVEFKLVTFTLNQAEKNNG
jgi:hypothetical protein